MSARREPPGDAELARLLAPLEPPDSDAFTVRVMSRVRARRRYRAAVLGLAASVGLAVSFVALAELSAALSAGWSATASAFLESAALAPAPLGALALVGALLLFAFAFDVLER